MDSKRLHLPVMGEQPAAPARGAAEIPPDAPLNERVTAVLKTIYDPEIPVSIYDLGLIYELKIDPPGAVAIKMTLTSPGCPVAMSLVGEVQTKVAALAGVNRATVDLVWDPPWDRSRMSEETALLLGLD
jgi:FeS assembly SUF system protein